MQEISLNEEFFNENLAESTRKAHPLIYFQEYFGTSSNNSSQVFERQPFIDFFQKKGQNLMNFDLLEELIDRLTIEKNLPLTLNEFLKVIQEAEIILILKILYLHFLSEQNKDFQSKIENLLQEVYQKNLNDQLSKKNLVLTEISGFIGFLETPYVVLIKYGDFLYESLIIQNNGEIKNIKCEIPLDSLDDLLEITVLSLKNNSKKPLGKGALSYFYLDFLKKNTVGVKISPNLEIILNLDFKFSDRKRLISQLEAKTRLLDKEFTSLKQEAYAFKSHLNMLLKYFDTNFDCDEFYKFNEIPIHTPNSFRVLESQPIEEKTSFSKNFTQNTPAVDLKELKPEFEPRTPRLSGEKKVDFPEKQSEIAMDAKMNSIINGVVSEKSPIERKIRYIISSNRNEKHENFMDNGIKIEEMVLWKRLLLRCDIITMVFILFAIMVNTQRNLFLDVFVFFILLIKNIYFCS